MQEVDQRNANPWPWIVAGLALFWAAVVVLWAVAS